MLQQLSAQDAQFLYVETPTNLTQVTGMYIYDPSTAPGGKVRFKDIIDHIRQRLHVSPVFKRKLYRLPFDLDHPYWVEDEHFDLEAHFSHSRLPEPGDWRQLCIQLARHHSTPMNLNRPLWDMHVIEGLDKIAGYAKGSYALVTRMHHCTIDGASGVHFFGSITDSDAKGTPAIPLPDDAVQISDLPNPAEILNRAVTSTLSSPVKLTQALLKLTPAIASNARKKRQDGNEESKTKIPDTRFNQQVTPHKVFEGATFNLDEIKKMRLKVEGATINDVVLAISSGAVRLYLNKHKELPKDSLIAMAPVNMRSREGEEVNPGNNISAMTVKIWSNIVDPLERLEKIRDTTRETKAAKSGLSARVMTDITQHIPGVTMAGVARILTNPRFTPKLNNMMVSNVPGPQMETFMNGARLTHQYGMAPISHGMGLFITALSYNGALSFSVVSDRKIMPDIAFFRECIEKSFGQYRDAKGAFQKGKTAGKKRTQKTGANTAREQTSNGSNYHRVSKRRTQPSKSK